VTARDVLINTRGLIVEHGWVQGTFGSEGEGFCVLGAFRAQTHQVTWRLRVRAVQALEDATGTIDLPGWNDDTPGRTQQEVLAAFDRAIEKAG